MNLYIVLEKRDCQGYLGDLEHMFFTNTIVHHSVSDKQDSQGIDKTAAGEYNRDNRTSPHLSAKA